MAKMLAYLHGKSRLRIHTAKIYGLSGNYIMYANTTIYVSISTYNPQATPNLNIET